MACSCEGGCASSRAVANEDPKWRRALWIALVVNAGMFAAEIVAGLAAGSSALQADALDFLGDSINYGIAIGVVGLGLAWRARAALVKGIGLVALGLWVIGSTVWYAVSGTLPRAEVMGVVGLAALLANGGVALMLYRFRDGDANMRSVWICSRNDAIGNLAVLAAALGVFGSGTGWPDFAVAAIMAGLSIHGGLEIVRHARTDIAAARTHELGGLPAAGE
jgi:Co/Zn/Cd efflux system component